MLRQQLNTAMKEAMKAGDKTRLATVRLILANLKQKDIDGRVDRPEGLTDTEILQLLQTMIKQRRESITIFEKAGRDDLATREKDEVHIIETFLPHQMSDLEIKTAIERVISDTGATSPKDMGRLMSILKDKYAGQMDFGKASQIIKQCLT